MALNIDADILNHGSNHIHCSPSSQLDTPPELCSTCQTLNLSAIIRLACPNCSPAEIGLFGCSDPLASKDRVLGPHQTILENVGCPACRLLASCIRSSKHQLSPSSTAMLRVMRTHKYPQGTPGLSSGCIEVLVQEPGGKAQLVGKVVPVGPGIDKTLQAESVFCTSKTDLTIMGRLIPPTLNVRLVRQWMKHCETNHTECCQVPSIGSEIRTQIRLIDVQERRIVEKTLDTRYVALSYVWGAQITPILTKKTLEFLTLPNSLTEEILPKTIHDALQLVSDIGEKYLWVDSACIIQDEPGDKQLQLPIMDRIYNGAALVVVAAAGGNADAGLPGRGETNRATHQQIETIQQVQLINIHSDLVDVLSDSVWSRRGWTFQETLLSRRSLIFTDQQVYWSCRCDTWCEDQYTSDQELATPVNWYSSVFGPRKSSSCGWVPGDFIPCETQIYCARVLEYSDRELSDEGDALWAFMGILKSMMVDFKNGFIWAMPYDILDAALLWRSNCPYHYHRRSGRHSAVKLVDKVEPMAFPTYSWLSVDGGVYYPDTCDDTLVSEVEWHEPICYESADRFYKVVDCGLTAALPAEEETDETPLATIDSHGTDFGLLQFTAQTSTLRLRIKPETEGPEDAHLVAANMLSPTGQIIGTTWAEKREFSDDGESTGEFVLLSSYQLGPEDAECEALRHPEVSLELKKDYVPCKHRAELNVMLITWHNEVNKVAHRVSWTRITRDAWNGLEVTKKRLILV